VDLPTYTNIWRIEKRLYKLYDFRLPMPLPIGQIAVFAAIALPYIIVLTILGLPFSHTYFWLYVLPPGVLAWLVTRFQASTSLKPWGPNTTPPFGSISRQL